MCRKIEKHEILINHLKIDQINISAFTAKKPLDIPTTYFTNTTNYTMPV